MFGGKKIPKVFPARAGMIPGPANELQAKVSIPRESGDDPKPKVATRRETKYSPRERG